MVARITPSAPSCSSIGARSRPRRYSRTSTSTDEPALPRSVDEGASMVGAPPKRARPRVPEPVVLGCDFAEDQHDDARDDRRRGNCRARRQDPQQECRGQTRDGDVDDVVPDEDRHEEAVWVGSQLPEHAYAVVDGFVRVGEPRLRDGEDGPLATREKSAQREEHDESGDPQCVTVNPAVGATWAVASCTCPLSGGKGCRVWGVISRVAGGRILAVPGDFDISTYGLLFISIAAASDPIGSSSGFRREETGRRTDLATSGSEVLAGQKRAARSRSHY